ncbi:MAG: hypothetical protein R3F17_15435 [Planctomycetota bacterium]
MSRFEARSLPPAGVHPGLDLPEALSLRLDRAGNGFLVSMMRSEVARRKRNHGALTVLSQSLSRLGRHAEGRDVDERLVALSPKHPVAHYNLACSRALTEDAPGALDSLERAVRLGFHDADYVLADPDLVSLHGFPRFQSLVQTLRAGASRPSGT